MKKKILAAALGVGLLTGGAVLGVKYAAPVLAATAITYPAPIANIAKVFNLDPAKVQQAFNDGRNQERTTRLDELVTAGKLTATQKAKLIELEDKVQAKRQELIQKGITGTDMRTQMDAVMKELRDYVTDQKLESVLGPGEGMGRGMGGRGMGMRDGTGR